MPTDPRVLVVASDDDRIGPLCEGLDALGWRTVTARDAETALAALTDLPLEAAIVDGASPVVNIAALKAGARPRSLPVLWFGPGGDGADLSMARPPHPAQAALRIEQLARGAIADEEFRLRRQSFIAAGVDLPEPMVDAAPLRILVAGQPDRRFLGLSNALAEAGAETVAAPTPYTAFDYLHESAFDAAVLWGGEDHAPALSIASGMKRNTRLYHIPLMLYLRSPGDISLADVFHRGFSDVASADTDETETARRIIALGQTYRRHLAIRRALDAGRDSGGMEAATGLFGRDLFAAHLKRIAEGARDRRRPLSVCVLRVAESSAVTAARQGGWLDRALPQIGAMVSRLVRVEDTAARLASEVFALALPATRGPAARLAAERIAAVIACTAFDAGQDKPPFVVEFQVGVAELSPGETPAGALERASHDLRASTRV
ncbi:diguanylate cyclase [Brevundimonas sp. S30B]|uniref:diguanylate cyclase domain-containing protein n=1 Tax=unclassified Brevundimonas TaxID=2622653 RepID=UPI001071F2F6|nr:MULTISPECIES: diguanylate cyclase [unclassified Brevundimonas]QBX37900.1 diguanylate cyclase [Brevundimonas sp. MF30-B]TFW02745.1 diguanylate cyclase [Brevundimonas sp. S30B]